MSHITTSQVDDLLNNNNGSRFDDPHTSAHFLVRRGHHLFHITTIVNGVAVGNGVVAWSEQLQAFVGDGYNIPMSWMN